MDLEKFVDIFDRLTERQLAGKSFGNSKNLENDQSHNGFIVHSVSITGEILDTKKIVFQSDRIYVSGEHCLIGFNAEKYLTSLGRFKPDIGDGFVVESDSVSWNLFYKKTVKQP